MREWSVIERKRWFDGKYGKGGEAGVKMTTLCYIEQDGKYLMLYRNKKKNDINEGKWIGVGGHLEGTESPGECLLREVKEETGLTLTSWQFRGIVTFVPGPDQVEYMCVYTADGFSGDLRECSEGELRWIPKEEVESLSLWEGDRLFMPLLLREDVPFFSMKLVYEGDRLVYAGLDGGASPVGEGGKAESAAERAENASGRVRIAGGPEEGWRLVWEKSFC